MTPTSDLEIALTLLALGLSLWTRPWRLLENGDLISPMLAVLVFLPWLWSLPFLPHMPFQIHWSGAPLVTLILGWPLATPVLTVVAGMVYLWTNAPLADVLSLLVWQGLVPSLLTLLLGAALRQWVARHIFVYVLGRGFLGSVLCIFLSSLMAQALGHELPHVGSGLSIIGYWLMAWGDAFITGMLCAIFVAFKPQWLATWSDRLYLSPP